jgi:glucokinase
VTVVITAGVDLGGTKIQAVVMRGQQVAGQARRPTPQSAAGDVVAAMADLVRESLALAGVTAEELQAVGVGSPGVVDSETGVVSRAANVPGFDEGVALGPELSKALGAVPVMVDNDVRVAVVGEHRLGAGRGYSDLLGVFVGTGVGGGLVLSGQLRRGLGAAGEIGHAVVHPDGRRCSCGRRGCLEAYAGRQGIERQARKRQAAGTHTSLFQTMEKMGRDRLTSGVIAQALKDGDRLAHELIDDAVKALGAALASAQNLLDMEAIVLGGGLADKLGPDFVERVDKAMRPHVFATHRSTPVLPTGLGDLSGAVGAAVAAASESVAGPGR